MYVAHSRLCLLCSLITYLILLNREGLVHMVRWNLSSFGRKTFVLAMLVNVFDPVVDVRWFDWQYSLTSNSTFDTESKFTSVLGDLKLKGSEIYNRTLWPWGPYLSPFTAHLVLAFSLRSHVYKHLNAVTWKNLNTLWHLLVQLPECE